MGRLHNPYNHLRQTYSKTQKASEAHSSSYAVASRDRQAEQKLQAPKRAGRMLGDTLALLRYIGECMEMYEDIRQCRKLYG